MTTFLNRGFTIICRGIIAESNKLNSVVPRIQPRESGQIRVPVPGPQQIMAPGHSRPQQIMAPGPQPIMAPGHFRLLRFEPDVISTALVAIALVAPSKIFGFQPFPTHSHPRLIAVIAIYYRKSIARATKFRLHSNAVQLLQFNCIARAAYIPVFNDFGDTLTAYKLNLKA